MQPGQNRPLPYADYVRIEIGIQGKRHVVEVRTPDREDRPNVEARVTLDCGGGAAQIERLTRYFAEQGLPLRGLTPIDFDNRSLLTLEISGDEVVIHDAQPMEA